MNMSEYTQMLNHLADPHVTRNFPNFQMLMNISKYKDEKPFSCFLCDEKFFELSFVNENFKIHMDEKPSKI